jgi:Rrf2 family transcriptional regulator, iron-sulfur cluster assembly transcription factor
MRLTRAGEYAVRCVLYLAFRGQGKTIGRKEIARAMDIPDQFLSKIARQLMRAGIIEIIQGAKGGCRLLKQPKNVSLLTVIEAVIGEIFLNDCVMNPDSCHRHNACSIHLVWEKARDQLRATLDAADFESLANDLNCFNMLQAAKEISQLQNV